MTQKIILIRGLHPDELIRELTLICARQCVEVEVVNRSSCPRRLMDGEVVLVDAEMGWEQTLALLRMLQALGMSDRTVTLIDHPTTERQTVLFELGTACYLQRQGSAERIMTRLIDLFWR